ncbi:MAG: GNAT family N-acetyltransferase [Actinomycetota bacterium]
MEIRPANPEEMGRLAALTGYVYGGSFGDGPEAAAGSGIRPEWTLCAFDGERMAACYSTIPFTMRAAGRAMALGGVSTVGTMPQYRRRGLVRSFTERSFVEMFETGRPVAALWASQAAIYQRYGYSRAGALRQYSIDTVDIAFHDGDPGLGDVALHDPETGYPVAKAVYADFVADRMCYLHRAKPVWDMNAFAHRPEDGPVHVAVSHDGDGRPNGYAVYTLRSGRVEHPARGQELVVRDLAWLDLDGYRSLWSWFARHDLVGRVRWDTAPLDDPAPELLTEPRLLNIVDREGIWFRVIHAEAALAGRGYAGSGSVTIEVADDPLAPWNPGTYRLQVDDGEPSVSSGNAARRTGEGAAHTGTLTLTPKALASLFTGSVSARTLARWGLVDGEPSAVAAADALFALSTAPGCPDHF